MGAAMRVSEKARWCGKKRERAQAGRRYRDKLFYLYGLSNTQLEGKQSRSGVNI